MIITIDGPAASGKSTLARLLAEHYGFMHINSGLLFRAIAYLFKMHDMSKELTKSEIEQLIHTEDLQYTFSRDKGAEVLLHGRSITSSLKTPEIDKAASVVAIQPAVRAVLLDFQRHLAQTQSVIADGRDCGTVIFPYADVKFFLTASLKVRALRFLAHTPINNEEFEKAQHMLAERDDRDSQRAHAPLKPADDAFIIDTSTLTIDEVFTQMIAYIKV